MIFIKETVKIHSENIKIKEGRSHVRRSRLVFEQKIDNIWNMFKLFSVGIHHFKGILVIFVFKRF